MPLKLGEVAAIIDKPFANLTMRELLSAMHWFREASADDIEALGLPSTVKDSL